MAGLQGKVFAGYQLAAQIGTGGIAEVYRGHAQAGGREVAVKIIHPDFAHEPGFQARLQQSIAAAATLGNHPHVLPLLASGEENGYTYLVSPFVADGTLRDWLRRGGRLGADDVAPFIRQIANGLAHAHSRGVVHGNLKPTNVFLFEGRHVLLGDFGLLWDIAQLDMQGPGPGTEAVEFFAPEAFGGRAAQPGDIYSLGAVLFATLTGHAPFRGQTPAEVYAGHANKPVPPLAHFDPTLAPALQALDPVIAKAMAKRPTDRFPSAALVAQQVETTVQQAGGSGPASRFPAGFGASGGPSRFPGAGPRGPTASMALGSPLQSLDFPPLPSADEASGLMEQGHIAATWNDASAQQTQRVPAGAMMPPGMPGMMQGMPPGMMPQGAMNGGMPFPGGQYPGGPYPGMPYPGGQMAPPAGWPAGMPPGMMPGQMAPGQMMSGMPGPSQGAAPVNVIPGLGPVPLPGGNGFVSSGPPPGAQGAPFAGSVTGRPPGLLPEEAPREVKGYNATELGLPRLTALDMGGLAPDVEQQIIEQIAANTVGNNGANDASAAAGTAIVPAPRAQGALAQGALDDEDGEGWDKSGTYTAARGRYGEDAGESQEFSAAYAAPRSQWGYSEEMSAELSAEMSMRRPAPRRGSSRGGGRASGRGRWDDDESVELPRSSRGRRGGGRSSGRRDDYDDEPEYGRRDRYGQSARRPRGDEYDDEYGDDEPGGSPWLRPVLLTLIPLLILALGGVAVLNPSLCPISACASVSEKVHHLLGADGGPGSAAAPVSPLSTSPEQIQLSTTAGTAVSAPLKISNGSAASVDWKATTDLQWVTFTPTDGTVAAGANATVTVQAKPTGIAAGTYATTIVLTSGTTTLKVPLQVVVAAG